MTISGYSDSLEWVISMGIHIKSDKLARNGWEWHILAIIMVQVKLTYKVLKLNTRNSIF